MEKGFRKISTGVPIKTQNVLKAVDSQSSKVSINLSMYFN